MSQERELAYLRVWIRKMPTSGNRRTEIEWRWLRGYGAPERLTEDTLGTPYPNESRCTGTVDARHLLFSTERPGVALLRLVELVDSAERECNHVRCADAQPDWTAKSAHLAWLDGIQRPFQRPNVMNALPEDIVTAEGEPYPDRSPYRWRSIDPCLDDDQWKEGVF
jgi:hypothetical protein